MGVVIGNGDGEIVQIAAPPRAGDPPERIDLFSPAEQIPVDDADDAKRGYGTSQLYLKHGAYYGRWRTLDGRKLNRRIGVVRDENTTGGLTRTEAELQFRKLQEAEERRPIRSGVERRTLDEIIDSLRRRLAVEGARKSYLQNCGSMQRVHISPAPR